METAIRLPQAWAGWEALVGFREGREKILYLHGPAGSGKTHLAVRLAWEEAQKGKRTLFLLASSLHREEVPKGVEILVLDSLEEAWPEAKTGAQLHELVSRAARGEMGLILTALLPPAKALARLGAEGLARRVGPGTPMPGG
ncbi:MAG: ATP-binding protein [Thermus sp.]